MKERQGPLGRALGLAGDLAAAARRRQRDRAPRVVVYDAAGRSRSLAPDDPRHEALLEVGEELIEIGGAEA